MTRHLVLLSMLDRLKISQKHNHIGALDRCHLVLMSRDGSKKTGEFALVNRYLFLCVIHPSGVKISDGLNLVL